jgi:hypothetical protein
MILFSGTFQTDSALPTGASVKLTVYRNNILTDVSLTISAGQTLASNTTQSTDFRRGDLLDVRFNLSGVANLNGRDFAASFAFY